MQRLKRSLAREWPRFLIELVIVVCGVSISFAVQDWRESVRARAEERRILETIRSDLQVDQRTLGAFIDMLQRGREQLSGLLTKDDLQGKELDLAMDQAITYAYFTPITAGWKELELAGGSRLVQDKPLLRKLMELHSQRYAACEEWNRINRDFVLKRMIPYLDEEGPFVDGAFEGGIAGGMGKIHQALFAEVRFRNLVRTNRLFREGQRFVYEVAQKQLTEVQKMLDAALLPVAD